MRTRRRAGHRHPQQFLAPKIIGRDPFAIDAIFEDLRRSHVFDGGFAGALITALTGLEIALWDLKGKALDTPIYELLGGKFRDKMRVYADCQVEPGMDFAEIQAVVDEVLERGFTALKIDLDIQAYGHRGKEVATLRRTSSTIPRASGNTSAWSSLVEMVTTAAGKSVDVACDMHTRLDVPSAIRLARDLEQFHLMWLEEPVPAENIDAMREVKRATTTPICSGENFYLRHGFRELIEKQAVDMIMPDIPKCGGLSECRKIANMAEIYYIPFAPHNVSSPMGTHGLGARLRHRAQLPGAGVPLAAPRLLDDDHPRQDGHHPERLHHSHDRPGIGVELDEEVARQYQFPGTTWFAE